MSEKLKYFILGTLTTGAIYSIGTMIYLKYKGKKKGFDNKIGLDIGQYNGNYKIRVNKVKKELIETLTLTKNEMELIMRTKCSQGSDNDEIENKEFYKSLKKSIDIIKKFTSESSQT